MVTTPAEPETSLRSLPSNPTDFDKAVAPYRVMVRPWVHCADKIAGYVPPKDRLDSIEKEGLELAAAATMYQHGGSLDARFLLLSCIAGIALPRVLKYIDQEEARKEAAIKLPGEMAQAQVQMRNLGEQLEALKKQKAALEEKQSAVVNFPNQSVQ